MKTTTNIQISPKLHKQLKTCSKETGIKMQFLAEKAILTYLTELKPEDKNDN
jgi:hypothetical protein